MAGAVSDSDSASSTWKHVAQSGHEPCHVFGTATLNGENAQRILQRAASLLTTVYTAAGVKLTNPQEGCKLEDIKTKSPGRTAMLRSQTVNTIQDFHAQGKMVQKR